MNTQLLEEPATGGATPTSRTVVEDTLARGLAWMLAITIVQRTIGFVRNILICRLLDPRDLGTWNLMFSFLMAAAPLVVLGVPGSLVRYVEHYRQRCQLRTFLRHTLAATSVLTGIGIGAIILARRHVGWLTFGTSDASELVVASAAALGFVIAYNVTVELLTALRQVRWGSHIQFINSLTFTVIAVGLLWATSLRAMAVLLGYAAACFVSVLVGTFVLRQVLADDSRTESPIASTTLWTRIGPFVAWYWLSDLLMNLFETVDRLMIVHCGGLDEHAAREMIGQYHSSQIVGILLIAVIALMSRTLLSFLSHDWESGRHDDALAKLDFALKLTGLIVTAICIASLLAAPAIFTWALEGKYTDGYRVLPVTMAYCVWFGLLTVAVNFLWCREKPGLACLSIGIGLLTNIGLNYWWLPIWGLLGAVLATALANLVSLACVCLCCHRLGMRYSAGTIVALALPACLVIGIWPATACYTVVVWQGVSRGWLFAESEQRQLADLANRAYLAFKSGRS